MLSNLKTSTAVLASLSLAIPAPAFAQGNPSPQGVASRMGLELCDSADAPCVTEDGFVLADIPDASFEPCSDDLAPPCVLADGHSILSPEGDEVAALMASMDEGAVEAASDTVQPEPVTDEAISEDVRVAEEEAAEAADDTTVAESDTASAEGTTDETAENAEAAEPEVLAAPADDADAGDMIEDQTTAEVIEAPAEDAETAEMIEEDTTAEVLEAPTDDADAGDMIEEQTTAEVIEAPEDAQDDAAAGETASDASTESEDADVTAEADAVAEAESEPQDNVEAAEETVVVEEAPAAAAAAAASTDTASLDEPVEGAEVETEEVTEETSRSADQEFDTAATGDTAGNAAAVEDSGDDGLSNFEKAILLGLGAVAVGSILNNGNEVVSNSGDRVVVRGDDGDLQVLKDDDVLLRQPGSNVRTERFSDGSSRTIVEREDGTRIVTIRASDGSVIRRARVFADGTSVILFDDTAETALVDLTTLPEPRRDEPEVARLDATNEDALRAALAREMAREVNRTFSLRQVRNIVEVRELAPEIDLDAITFRSGSAAIDPTQAEELASLGRAMVDIIERRPFETFLIEGHTDAVGDEVLNLALSDRRAETVALALTQYFGVPPENLVVQGYGERFLKIDTQADERLNRRATVRRITPLLRSASAN